MKLDVSREDDYNIATALRGPDHTGYVGEIWKRMVTAVIRHFAGVRNGGGIVELPTEAIDWWNANPSLKKETRTFASEQAHVVTHARIAIRSLLNILKTQKKATQEVREYYDFLIGEKLI